MHLLDDVLKLVTLASVIIGATAIYIGLRNHSRQLGAQIFIAYTDRLHKLRRMVTIEANVYRLSWAAEEALTVAERHALLEAFYLVFEFYELRGNKYITSEIWGIWVPDIKRLLCTPIVCSEWPKLREEFEIHPGFVAWIEDGQRDTAPLATPPRFASGFSPTAWSPSLLAGQQFAKFRRPLGQNDKAESQQIGHIIPPIRCAGR